VLLYLLGAHNMARNIGRNSIIKKLKAEKPQEFRNVTIKVPIPLLIQLEKICKKEGVSRNALLVELIQQFVGGE
jgi:hypothetical protein